MPSNGEVIVIRPNGQATLYARGDVAFIDDPKRIYKTIELPPHGRMIDADALRRQWIEVEAKIGGDMRLDGLTLHDIITEGCVFDLDNAPTIIPAEEE
jgi:hypothetical protein